MKLLRYLTYAVCGIVLLPVLWLFVRVVVCDSFIIRGESMEPTLHDGERVFVNKMKIGARIYTDFDFTSPRLNSFRLPGLRRMEIGDVVVVNDPYYRCRDSITFTINHVYIKRCYGCPGDTVRISRGRYIHPQTGHPFGPMCFQDQLSEMGDSVLRSVGVFVDAWNMDKKQKWTISELGPVYVPKKGGTISLTLENYRSYRKQIQYETAKWLAEKGGKIFLDGNIISEYEFKEDWCFLGGDNVLNSRDSRYVGLMPVSFVVGVVNEM